MPLQPDTAINFETELNALAQQAAQTADEKSRPKDGLNLTHALRPLVIGIEAISRAQAEQLKLLARIETQPKNSDEISLELASLKDAWDHKEAIMERLFSSLHGELKTYKDDFLFDLLHKPVIKDLITLFDDLTAIQRQLAKVMDFDAGMKVKEPTGIIQAETNLKHGVHALEEILSRLQVERLKPHRGSLDKKLQRVVEVKQTLHMDMDNVVAESLRPGFMWRDRVIRPEDVIVFKYQQ